MKVQIYSHKSLEEAQKSVAAGVDFIGLVAATKGRVPTELSIATAREIVATLPHEVMKVALIFTADVPEILEIITAIEPNVVQLTGDIDEMPVTRVAELRQASPMVKIMRAIPVGGPETRERALRLALEHAHVVDFFILDTDHGDPLGIGATGALHDWNISAEIVRRLNVPVILAGGLGPDNVADAVRAVKPWGVDSYTHTNLPNSKLKDPVKLRAFVEGARSG